ncbi:MAG: hypothetical protein LT082_08970 [Comamonas sp.]|nr:hypothetical protein [Comamonas sp.]
MSFTPPPAAPAEGAPIPNRRTDAQEAFDLKTDAYLNWLESFRAWCAGLVAWCATFLTELGEAMTDIEADKNAAQVAAAAAEASAQGAAASAGAAKWVAGNYTQGDAVWSPVSLLIYRRTTPGTTASATDPAFDSDGWVTPGAAVLDALLDVPTNTVTSAAYTLQLTDRGKCVDVGHAITVPKLGTVAFGKGSIVNLQNVTATGITITAESGATVRLAGDASKTGPYTLKAYGWAVLRKIDAANTWVISGAGL